MIDIDKVRKAALNNERKSTDTGKRWRLVPVGYLVEFWSERAAIAEIDAALLRHDAESAATEQCGQRFRVYELVRD